jgi:ABC-type multidrug transport system fused ATPase/permease subunit
MTDAVDLDRVRRSCEFASFAEVVEEDPRGYDAQIGTEFGGREFSGGERQRLALARVRYRGTPVLILDEPDSDLDPESANRVIDAVFALQGVTVVLVTHHVSRAERCDKIIVMGKGRVVEQGTHEELMALGGVYVSLREKDRERLGAESPS